MAETGTATQARAILRATEGTAKASALRRLSDRMGICLSAVCVIHCMLMPVLFLFLPSLQIFGSHTTFHEVMLVVLPVLAIGAFVPGYRRHRDWSVFAWSLPGLVLIALAATLFEGSGWLEAAVSVSGSLLLIKAHLVNRRLCACCEAGHKH